MTLRNTSGTVLSKADFIALCTVVPPPETTYRLGSKVMETYSLSGESEDNFEAAQRQRFKPGAILTASEIDALFATATASSISPATGVAAGGTTVTISGTDLGGVKGVTFGGVAATEVKVKSKTKITCKTPAHATGAVTVVVQDDGGDVVKNGFYTYT